MQNGPKALRLARAITARPARGLRRDAAARDLPPSPRCSRVPMTAAEHIFSAAKGDHSCANAPTVADYASRLSSPRLLLVNAFLTFPHAVQQTVSSLRQHAAVVATIPRPSTFAALSDCTSHRRRKPIFAIVHASGLKRSVGQLFCGQDENLGSRL